MKLKQPPLKKLLLGTALILGGALLVAEGYLVYEFYSGSTPVSAALTSAGAGDTPDEASSPPTGLPQSPEAESLVADCSDERDECVRKLVETVAPAATYAGGRIDTDTEEPGQSRSVLFFEDPALDHCEYKQLEYRTNETETFYVVIIAGDGSYAEEDGADCVPQS